MKTINLTFLSLPREIVDFMASEAQRAQSHYLYILASDGRLMTPEACPEMIDKGGYRLLASNIPLDVTTAYTLNKIEERNPNLLFVNVGKFDGGALEESWAHTLKIANEENVNKAWNLLINRYKKRLALGGSIVSHTGEERYSKHIRFDKNLLKEIGLSFYPMYTRKMAYVLRPPMQNLT